MSRHMNCHLCGTKWTSLPSQLPEQARSRPLCDLRCWACYARRQMYRDLEPLTRLLRVELTAVHQQFFHMLALKQWKNEEELGRVTEIDTEDFQNAMQIIDTLVSRKQPIHLGAHQFVPGSDLATVLYAENRMEEQVAEVLQTLEVTGSDANARLKRASAPRPEYRAWLKTRLSGLDTTENSPATHETMAKFVAALIALVEQPMLHAFHFWQNDCRFEADNFWRISGAAMLYGAALIKRGALMNALPTPARIPSVRMGGDLESAFLSDRILAQRCIELGRSAARAEREETIQRLCLRIADDCDLIANMEIGGNFPATFGRSSAFESFGATRDRHLN